LGPTMAAHWAGQRLLPRRSALFRRGTDESVRKMTGKIPLDVGAEKIAHAAHHALDLLERLRILTSRPIPLARSPIDPGTRAIEVYPAATLRSRTCETDGYRKKAEGQSVRLGIAIALEAELPGLAKYAAGSVDVFDACLCLLAAKDFVERACTAPDDEDLAAKEGWIWVKPAPDKVSAVYASRRGARAVIP
jgi:hypothetical protein